MSAINALILNYFFGICRVLRDRRGVTALEYGLIATLIAVAILTALTNFGNDMKSEFLYLATKV